MSFPVRFFLPVLCIGLVLGADSRGQAIKPYTGAACAGAVEDYFAREVWPNVASVRCVTCHKQGGTPRKVS